MKSSPSVLGAFMGYKYVRRGTTKNASNGTMLGIIVLNIPFGITNMPCCTCFGDDQLLVEKCMSVQLIKTEKK